MNIQLDAIQNLIKLNREAARELARVENTTSADFVHIGKALDILNEQFHFLLQQKEEMELLSNREPVSMKQTSCFYETAPEKQPDRIEKYSDRIEILPDREKRGRGAVRQYYLKDEDLKPAFLAHLRTIFANHYTRGKQFLLPNGTHLKAPWFLACLYDLGIKFGITSPEAPVKDFCDMVSTVARECPCAADFNTAYNTVQKAIKQWNPLTGKPLSQLYCTNVLLHAIPPTSVPSAHVSEYRAWMAFYEQVELVYHATEEASRNSADSKLS